MLSMVVGKYENDVGLVSRNQSLTAQKDGKSENSDE
jgi:hypothetical protein